ncbi:hypothetical protein DFH09DRAFT_1360348 [Mycena vulgaris]|nr:hypothetical protein DFH09DRAFT_1360348 [Mycena vulgaris]
MNRLSSARGRTVCLQLLVSERTYRIVSSPFCTARAIRHGCPEGRRHVCIFMGAGHGDPAREVERAPLSIPATQPSLRVLRHPSRSSLPLLPHWCRPLFLHPFPCIHLRHLFATPRPCTTDASPPRIPLERYFPEYVGGNDLQKATTAERDSVEPRPPARAQGGAASNAGGRAPGAIACPIRRASAPRVSTVRRALWWSPAPSLRALAPGQPPVYREDHGCEMVRGEVTPRELLWSSVRE